MNILLGDCHLVSRDIEDHHVSVIYQMEDGRKVCFRDTVKGYYGSRVPLDYHRDYRQQIENLLARFFDQYPDALPVICRQWIRVDGDVLGWDANLYRFEPACDAIHCVYCITNKSNGRSYIGRTNNWSSRLKQHASSETSAVYSDIRRYGIDAFDCQPLIIGLTQAEALKIETDYIKRFSTLEPDGYNRINGFDEP